MKKYFNSEQLLERALKVIPLGTQTLGKSSVRYPKGVSPFYIEKGKGSNVWDVDGNKYIDFVGSLGPIILGYNDLYVLDAVKKQLENGPIFSLPHKIEIEVAEKIVEIIPWVQKVRFGKNGSDVTTAAIKLARAYTKRDHVAVCGYHGWHDWYVSSTSRTLGIPESVKKLTHKFIYNDIESLNKIFQEHSNQIAAVILEPMNYFYPKDNFLHKVKELTHKNGAVLIFDEMVTGFRFSLGGAQELFGVTPDLITFGKAIANGFPLSVVAGKADIMNLFNEVFISTTFGGETLSLAAALATITKLQNCLVIDKNKKQGEILLNSLRKLITKHKVENFCNVFGHPTWVMFRIKDAENYLSYQIKTLFLQEMFKRGMLTLGDHFINYAHSDEDLALLINAYDEILPKLKNAILSKELKSYILYEPLKPFFYLR